MTSASLLPAYGGPAYSISRLAVALTERGADVAVWAADQSAAVTPFIGAGCAVRRLTGSAEDAVRSNKPDVMHDNGIWWPHNHQLAQLAAKQRIPRLVSTRGMLEPWALRHKRLKKRAAWWLYQRRDLARARCHHATAELEARSVRQLDLGVPIQVIPNGMDVPALMPRPHMEAYARGYRTALFLGRLYPVKGLPMLIEAWQRVRPDGWVLKIAGPDEQGYRLRLEAAVRRFGLTGVISFVGAVDEAGKTAAFAGADLFVLPSYSENFGVAIAEALAHAVPVLTTTATPWSGLPERGCGWCVEPTMDAIADALREATSLPAPALKAMGATGRDFISAEFAWPDIAKRFLTVYESICR